MCFGIGCVVLVSKQKHYYMILPNELRIGNWLIDIKFGSYIRFKSFFGLCNVETNPDLYNPIPLTPEILEKAGFKYDEGMESYDLFTSSGLISIATDYSFFIGDNHLECGFAGGNKSLVKYLHQLQNLYFALTGEELQIDL